MVLHIFIPEDADDRGVAQRLRASALSLARRTGVIGRGPAERQLFPPGTRRRAVLLAWRRLRERNTPLLVVVGCGRSGTRYLATLFEQLGITSGHEDYEPGIGQRLIASWPLAGSGIAVPWGPDLQQIAHRKLIIVHQTRDPLKVVSSLETFQARSWNYIAKHIECDRDRPLRRGMQYWLHWNRLAEARACFTYQLESIEQALPRLVREAEINISEAAVAKALASTSRRSNARVHSTCTWDDLDREDPGLARDVRDLARHYGYAVQS